MRVVVPEIPFRQALLDFATPLQAALDDIGAGPGELWFGAHFETVMPPADAVIFQTEVAGSPWFRPVYQRKLERARAVWDYSTINRKDYNARAWSHVPLRYHPTLERVRLLRLQRPPDIPLGFYGSLNERRLAAVPKGTALLPRGCFGSLRSTWLARVRCVLVPHYYPGAPVEQARVGVCLANGIAVVAEHAPDEHDFPGPIYCELAELGRRGLSTTNELELGEQQRAAYVRAGLLETVVREALAALP